MRFLVVLVLIARSFAIRKRRSAARSQASEWSTTTDGSSGPCASHINKPILPIHFPLLCTGEATQLKLSTKAWGYFSPQLRFVIDDGIATGRIVWDFFPVTKTWTVDLDIPLSKGMHTIAFFPNDNVFDDFNIEILSVTLEGQGGACHLDEAPGQSGRMGSQAYSGFDAINRLFGADRDFSSLSKHQLYFTEEGVGTNDDGSISSTVVHEGIWTWLYSYTQNPSADDPLRSILGGQWSESKMGPPWPQLSLNPVTGRSGQLMEVIEPCNTMSALTFSEAAMWLSCKSHPFSRDEFASVVAAFNALNAGTAFQHVCACKTGGKADTFTMDWLLNQIYQILIRPVINHAGDNLTPEEKELLLTFGYGIGDVTNMAKNLTRLFSEKYDHPTWDRTIRAFPIPAFDKAVAGLLSTAIFALADSITVPAIKNLLDTFLTEIMNVFELPDKEFWVDTYFPLVKKAVGFANLCPDATGAATMDVVKFCLTFVEALVFQEKQIPVPKTIRDIVAVLDDLGLTSHLMSDMVISWDYYNGFDCKNRSDHANWHEKASHGLVHAMNLAETFVTRIRADPSQC